MRNRLWNRAVARDTGYARFVHAAEPVYVRFTDLFFLNFSHTRLTFAHVLLQGAITHVDRRVCCVPVRGRPVCGSEGVLCEGGSVRCSYRNGVHAAMDGAIEMVCGRETVRCARDGGCAAMDGGR